MLKRNYLPAVLVMASAFAAPACASQRGFYRYPGPARVDNRAYEQGYREGRAQGERDARRYRSFDYARHDEYREADQGYLGYGDRNEYRRLYRRGFEAGYKEAYRRYARDGSRYPQYGPYGDRYPNRGVFGFPAPGYGPYGRYQSNAANNGLRDGYDEGRDDARHGRRYDPIGAKRYRSGDHDYDRRYGSVDDYKRDYRAAFERGYDQGYREGR